jgi:hypothetical protein
LDRFGLGKSKINTMKQLLTLTFFSIFGLTHAQVPSYVPINGLVGWWPFNGNANDESGNGNNGTVNGATLTSDRNGVVNGAYEFNGSSILIPLTQQMVQMPKRTVSLWFKSAQAQSGGRLFEATNYSWGIGCYNSTTFDCWYQKSNQAYNFVGETFSNHNTWHHLVFICDSISQQKILYLNGVQINLGIPVSNPGQPIDWINHFLKIGLGNANEAFTGSIDDIGIWNRALTDCEIQDLYHAQVGFTTVDAGQDQTICRGADVTLNGTGGSSLSWNNGVVNGVAFAPNQTSNYILTGSDSLGCVGTDTVLVTVLDNASSTINQTAIDSYTLNGQTYTQSGTYTQVLTGANGCDSTITLNLELDFTGIQTNTLSSLKLYPNPVQDVLHIDGLAGKEFEYEVLSIDGKLLQKGKSQGEISVKELRKGNYLLRVGQQQVSFVKQ